MKIFGSFVLLIFVLGLACAPAPVTEEPIDLEAEKSALLEADGKWAAAVVAADDKATVISGQFVDGAHLLAPEMPLVKGKEAIHGAFEQLMAIPGMALSWTPSMADVSAGADMGYTIGVYKMKLDGPDSNPVEIVGKYKTVWRKQADGSWKVLSDMFNADAPTGGGE